MEQMNNQKTFFNELLASNLRASEPLVAEVLELLSRDTTDHESYRDIHLHLYQLVQQLAGVEVKTGQTVVSFGENNNIGTINFRDIAGRDIVNININNNPQSLPSFEEDAHIQQVISAISTQSYDTAIRICEKIIEQNPTTTTTKSYLAIALLKGKSPNTLHPYTLSRIESLLMDARQQDGGLSRFILAIIELEYYNYHGISSSNGVDSSEISQLLNKMHIDATELEWIRSLDLRRSTRRRLKL